MEHSSKLKIFLLSFFSALLLLSVPYGMVLFSNISKDGENSEATPAKQTAQSLTLLVSCADRGETPGELLLISLSPSKGRVAYAAIPGETMVETEDGNDTLSIVWRDSGGREAANALASLIGVSIDRYLGIPKNSLITLLDQAGTIDFTIEQQTRSQEPVRRILDGNAMLSLVYSRPKEERSQLVASLTGEMLSQRGRLLRPSDIEKIYLTAVNAGENDLTAADYETRREALNMLFASDCTVAHIVISGKYNDAKNTFVLSDSSVKAMELAIGGYA